MGKGEGRLEEEEGEERAEFGNVIIQNILYTQLIISSNLHIKTLYFS